MIKFEKVSYEQFRCDVKKSDYAKMSEEAIKEAYREIRLPKRATKASAGYDFYAPFDIKINCLSTKFPTGIRCKMNENVVLLIVLESSLGFTYNVVLDNTIGVIDADHYYAKNEGHIQCKMHNETDALSEIVEIKKGERYAQGIFIQYLKTDDDDTQEERIGGLGSTNGK